MPVEKKKICARKDYVIVLALRLQAVSGLTRGECSIVVSSQERRGLFDTGCAVRLTQDRDSGGKINDINGLG